MSDALQSKCPAISDLLRSTKENIEAMQSSGTSPSLAILDQARDMYERCWGTAAVQVSKASSHSIHCK